MPTTNKTIKTNNESGTVNANASKNLKNDSQPTKREKDLEKQVQDLTRLVQELLNKNQGVSNTEQKPTENLVEINPNTKTKVVSLTYGFLSLYAPNRGYLKFNNYGDIRIVNYAQLVDYVNNCRNTAEQGKFYIYNQQMVQDLGLGEAYERILSDTIFQNICSSEKPFDIDLVKHTTIEQKNNLINIFAQKIYNGEIIDGNRIDALSKAVECDIREKVKEMQQTQNFIK